VSLLEAEMSKKRVNIALDEDIHTKAKVIAVLTNTTLNDYFEKAIAEAIEKDKKILEKIK
jgi:predicted HicB family RNase H-like nuclease